MLRLLKKTCYCLLPIDLSLLEACELLTGRALYRIRRANIGRSLLPESGSATRNMNQPYKADILGVFCNHLAHCLFRGLRLALGAGLSVGSGLLHRQVHVACLEDRHFVLYEVIVSVNQIFREGFW